jgi:mRNA-degrading endonuclease RelE of RelBE toxin-antitoxin system
MDIGYTYHALDRMWRRGISKHEIEEAIEKGNAETTRLDRAKSTYRNQRGTLIVIYDIEGPRSLIVITAYYKEEHI